MPETGPGPAGGPPAPLAALQNLILGKWMAQAVSVAAKLGIADMLKDGPRACDELARANQVDEPTLYRVLRALASLGVFLEVDDRQFGLTPMAEFLRSDVRGSMRAVATMAGEDWTWRPWGDLYRSVKTGERAFDRIFGVPPFTYLAENPGAAAIFDEAMTGWSMLNSAAVAAAYDFSGIGTLMDVGGGHGYSARHDPQGQPSASRHPLRDAGGRRGCGGAARRRGADRPLPGRRRRLLRDGPGRGRRLHPQERHPRLGR